jgi:membrane protein DedA with SNARE-associated domain
MNFTSINLIELVSNYGYWGLFVFRLMNWIIPPEVVLTFAGYQLEQGNLNFILVILAALCSSFIKTSVIFGVGDSFAMIFYIVLQNVIIGDGRQNNL